MMEVRTQQLERELWKPNCDPGKFEVMLDVMKLQDPVIAASSLINS
jgi:hypothetical protein